MRRKPCRRVNRLQSLHRIRLLEAYFQAPMMLTGEELLSEKQIKRAWRSQLGVDFLARHRESGDPRVPLALALYGAPGKKRRRHAQEIE